MSHYYSWPICNYISDYDESSFIEVCLLFYFSYLIFIRCLWTLKKQSVNKNKDRFWLERMNFFFMHATTSRLTLFNEENDFFLESWLDRKDFYLYQRGEKLCCNTLSNIKHSTHDVIQSMCFSFSLSVLRWLTNEKWVWNENK